MMMGLCATREIKKVNISESIQFILILCSKKQAPVVINLFKYVFQQ